MQESQHRQGQFVDAKQRGRFKTLPPQLPSLIKSKHYGNHWFYNYSCLLCVEVSRNKYVLYEYYLHGDYSTAIVPHIKLSAHYKYSSGAVLCVLVYYKYASAAPLLAFPLSLSVSPTQ